MLEAFCCEFYPAFLAQYVGERVPLSIGTHYFYSCLSSGTRLADDRKLSPDVL